MQAQDVYTREHVASKEKAGASILASRKKRRANVQSRKRGWSI